MQRKTKLILIFIISVFIVILLFTACVPNDTEENGDESKAITHLSSDDKRAIFDGSYGEDASKYATSTYYGVGRTLNVLTDEYITLSAGYKKIFDVDKLINLNWNKSNVGKMDIESRSGSSMEEMYINANLNYNNSVNASAKINGLFTAGFDSRFGFTAGGSYKNTTNEIYIQSSQIYAAKLIEIDEYYDLDKFASVLSKDALSDIAALENGQIGAESFVLKYGTHVVLAGYYGGRLDFDYYLRNKSTMWDANLAASFQSQIEAYAYNIINAKAGTSLEIAAELGMKSVDVEERVSVSSIGGSNFSAQTKEDYFANYSKWVDSINEQTEYSCIVGLPTRSLAAIWDIIPNQYSKAKQILSKYFKESADNVSQEFLSKYERHYAVSAVNGDTQNFSGGMGTVASPYLISDAAQFANIKKSSTLNKYYKLTNSINLGIWNSPFTFSGNLDGDGNTITYYQKLTQTGDFLGGLFTSLTNATIGNLKLDVTIARDLDKSGIGAVGALAGKATGLTNISKVATSGVISIGNYSGYDYVGGIIGQFYGGTIDQCTNDAEISDWARNARTGGIVGYCQGSDFSIMISNCYNKGDLKSSSKWTAAYGGRSSGGIAGQVKGTKGFKLNIVNCYNDSNVKLEWEGVSTGGWSGIGGIFGDIASGNSENLTVSACVWNTSKCKWACASKTTYNGTVGKTDLSGIYENWSTNIWSFSNYSTPQLLWLIK